MVLTPFVVVWACLAVVVLGLALARNLAALHEDDNLHIAAGEEQKIPQQVAFFRMMDKIDRWGKTLTVITVAGGLVLAAVYLYETIGAHNRLG